MEKSSLNKKSLVMVKDNKKDAHYFTHDSNASQDPKIIALLTVYGVEGYGRFWLLIEFLRQQDGYKYDITQKWSYSSLSNVLKCTYEECKRFMEDCIKDFELLNTDHRWIWSDSLCRRMEIWDEKKRILSERGQKGAQVTNHKRWNKSAQATEEVGTSEDFVSKEEKRIEDNIKEKNSSESEAHSHTDLLVINEEYAEELPDELTLDWNKLQDWMRKHTPRVLQMKEPLTIDQFPELMRKYQFSIERPTKLIGKILKRMNNWEGLLKKINAFQTFEQFFSTEKMDMEIVEFRDGPQKGVSAKRDWAGRNFVYGDEVTRAAPLRRL